MKLYNANLSNFASKCRLAIYEKNAPVELVPIPGDDLKSPAYLKISTVRSSLPRGTYLRL